ncbi:MAG: DNRLRE domain-containing protein [Candidatus Cloacimonetes bacterium]|nr:DNRLRE domain-containing protein [Candidatus Cloacimonadota bacterium]
MKKNKIILLTVFTLFILILSCTKKNNFIGFDENIDSYVIDTTITNSINYIKSYKDSILNYHNNSDLIVGKFNDIEVRTLLKFKNLPDTSWIDSVTINSCEIILKKHYLFNSDFNIKVYELNNNWEENTVIWDSINFEGMTELVDFLTNEDTISFSIDTILVKNWIESDTTNYGIIFEAENLDSNFVEFYSSYTDDYPSLRIVFTGISTSKMDTITYKVSEDTFIGFDSTFFYSNILDYEQIGNLSPTRTIISVNLDSLANAISPTLVELEKISINLAELIFDSTMIANSLVLNSYLGVRPYYISDTINIEYEFINGTVTSEFYQHKEFKINITGIVQGQIRKYLDNNQILLKSTTENKDFSYIRFVENKTPHLHIIYTKPIIDY